MSSITEIQQAILSLPAEDYDRFRRWFTELDWERWDREIEADAAAGLLDSLVAEALQAKENGTLQEL